MRLPSSYESIVKFTDFQLYIAYLALKNHFTKDSYDFHKYQGKVGASASAFENRKDRYAFQKLSRHRDAFGVLFANILHHPDVWIGAITSDNAGEQIYSVWKKRQESLSYSFKEELKKIGNIDDALFVEPNGQPALLKMMITNQLSIETVCLLQACLNFIPYWDAEMEPVVWTDHRRRIVKYLPFLEFDRDKIKAILAIHDEETA
jgi:hypothetical protein